MRVRWFLSSFLIVVIFILIGCNNNNKYTSENELNNNDSTIDLNKDSSIEDNNNKDEDDIFEQNNASNTIDDFTENEIKEFILYADSLIVKIIDEQDTSSEKIIGKHDNIDVVEITGEYDTFDKVKQLMGDYYTDEVIEMELDKNYLVNLYGKIGGICASGENSYYISESSHIYLLVDKDNKKVVEMEVFNDNDNISQFEYTIEKQNSGKWIITDIKGYLYAEVNETEKQLYCNDKFSLIASSQLNEYPSANALDDNLQTAWVEGVDDNGIGEWLEFRATGNHEVSGIELINGYVKSDDLYNENNRVKKVKIELSDDTVIEKELEDGILDYQIIEFEKVVAANSIKITIVDVYPGSKYNDTCISEIKVYR